MWCAISKLCTKQDQSVTPTTVSDLSTSEINPGEDTRMDLAQDTLSYDSAQVSTLFKTLLKSYQGNQLS